MNNIVIEWSAEDRARVDKLIELLEGVQRPACDKCVKAAVAYGKGLAFDEMHETPAETPQEDAPAVPDNLEPSEVVNAPETAQEAKEEQPAPTVTKQDIQQKVIELVGKGKKAEVRDIITTYADNVSGLPDSVLAEVWGKLIALEG